jgi:hypothetical protein
MGSEDIYILIIFIIIFFLALSLGYTIAAGIYKKKGSRSTMGPQAITVFILFFTFGFGSLKKNYSSNHYVSEKNKATVLWDYSSKKGDTNSLRGVTSLNKINLNDSSVYMLSGIYKGIYDSIPKKYLIILDEDYIKTLQEIKNDSVLVKYLIPPNDTTSVLNKKDSLTRIHVKILKSNSKNLHKKKLSSSQMGDFDFYLNDTMTVNQSYKAFLLISKKMIQVVKTDLSQKVFNYIKNIKDTSGSVNISENMLASLTDVGNGNFKILRNDLDSIKTFNWGKNNFISWEWVVTPLKSGDTFLNLKIYTLKSKNVQGDELIPGRLIRVKVYAEYKNFFEKVLEFISIYWLVLTAIGAIFTFLIKFYFEYRKHSKRKSY